MIYPHTSTVGLVSDINPYLKYLINQIGFKVLLIDSEPSNYASSGFPSELENNGTKVRSVVVYAHVGQDLRQTLRGVNWILKFRMLGFITPIVLLGWDSALRIRTARLLSNPFIGAYSKESCSIIRFPLESTELKDSLLRVRPIDNEHWHQGRRWATRASLNHELVGVARTARLNDARASLERIIGNLAYTEYSDDLNLFRRLTTTDDLRIAISRFVQG